MREVKLLSRLHHDNVVRYYTSWIESVDKPESEGDDSSLGGESESDEDTSISIKISLLGMLELLSVNAAQKGGK